MASFRCTHRELPSEAHPRWPTAAGHRRSHRKAPLPNHQPPQGLDGGGGRALSLLTIPQPWEPSLLALRGA